MEAAARILTPRLVDLGDTRLEVFVGPEGAPGPDIVTTHQYVPQNGFVGAWASTLMEGGRLWAVNGRGSGNSARESSRSCLTMAQAVEDLEALRRAMGIRAWVYAGTSTGGMIGLLYALRYPDSISALLLNGTAASWRYILEPECVYNPVNPHNTRAMLVMAPLYLPKPPVTARRRWSEVILELGLRHKERLSQLLEERGELDVERLLAYVDEVRPPKPYDVEGKLGEIDVPTLVTCGRFDNQCPIAQSRILCERMPGAQLRIFEDSGHFPYVDEPEAFQESVKRFIEVVAHG